jgi:hypothetical protein
MNAGALFWQWQWHNSFSLWHSATFPLNCVALLPQLLPQVPQTATKNQSTAKAQRTPRILCQRSMERSEKGDILDGNLERFVSMWGRGMMMHHLPA